MNTRVDWRQADLRTVADLLVNILTELSANEDDEVALSMIEDHATEALALLRRQGIEP